ncbi:sulfate permease [Changpingibacter yushuensis]|uniref:sulfate permease n=1 Tax=Changpingibacter yushuensis TaxID=2758440 RepID=UPI00165E399A|nr:sulfate permease [Changpingibacter yushuensis]
MPSNIILDLARTRRGLNWGPVAMLLAAPYAVAAYWLTAWIKADGPELPYFLVLVCLWSALKMIWIGPVSIVLLLTNWSKHRAARPFGPRSARIDQAPHPTRIRD